MRRRAERQEETRQRIVAAAVELHTTLGPAHTTDVAIAERAGVTRRTFYRHFPDGIALFRACTQHGFARWPPPDLERWRAIADPDRRLRAALLELYAYYRAAGPGMVVIGRDFPLLPPEFHAVPSRMDVVRAMPDALLVGRRERGRRRAVLRAALAHATSPLTWHSLIAQQGLTDAEAVALLVAMVRATGTPRRGGAAGGTEPR